MDWSLIAAIGLGFLVFVTGASQRLITPLLEIGPIKMDWRDIIALLLVGVVIYALYRHSITEQDVIKILAGILIGKLVSA